MISKRLATLSVVASLSAAGVAAAAPPAERQVQGHYRGMYVCQKAGAAPDILRVPIDLTVRTDAVEFARPLFNARGTRVIGNEMASGNIDPDGKIHMTSNWDNRGFTFTADYTGTFTPGGGTFIGTQTWHGPNDVNGSRTCTAALVQTAQAQQAPSQQQSPSQR